MSPHSKLAFKEPGREGVEYTGEDGQHGRPGAWDRMQSDNHTQALLAPKVQRELQRVLWQAITSRKRTLFGRPINDLEALFDAVRANPMGARGRLLIAGCAGGQGQQWHDLARGAPRGFPEARCGNHADSGAQQQTSLAAGANRTHSRRRKQLERLVATIDADDDGGISYEELDGWMAERA